MTPSIRRLLVPIDFSPGATHASDYALVLAGALGASVHLLHIVEESFAAQPSWEYYQREIATVGDRILRDAQGKLDTVAAAFIQAGARVTTQVCSGRPAREIVAIATSRGSDLIVMGTHGRGGLYHVLYGSVAERVVRKAPCPVLAIRDPGMSYIPAASANPSLGVA